MKVTIRGAKATPKRNTPKGVTIQSMCSTDTEDVRATVAQIKKLEKEGCDMIRVAVPTVEAAQALSAIKKKISIPLIADIHFNPKLALLALENGADKIRINPGNIADKKALKEIALAAKKHKASIRIGVNAGSLEADLAKKHGPNSPKALAESAKRWIKFFEKIPFKQLYVSVKSSDVKTMIEANRLLKGCGYPLHLGVTESGTLETGTIKSAIGIGSLLADGIGDTIRVSLAADPAEEVRVAKKILDTLWIKRLPLQVIACPTCGRTKSNVWQIAEKLEHDLKPSKPTTVAVLGCGVNVVGESKAADYTLVGIDRNHFSLLKKQRTVLKNTTYSKILTYLRAAVGQPQKN